ncbi:prepilin peptidase, partial [Candidatus Falkowbacteria bacterium]|nr:prepilin peptidase [Candidatus Falkowbacteria bacterium]
MISKKFQLRGIYCNLTSKKFNWHNLFVEIISAATLTYAFYTMPTLLFLTSLLFFSALLVTMRTDMEHMLISEAVTLSIIPAGIALSYFNYTWATWQMSLAGAVTGYFSLWIINKLFFIVTKKEGIGAGDMDLLAMIGSFTGLLGIWFSILVGSITASIFGI